MGTFEPTTAGLLALALQFVLPLVVGLVTKRSWPSGVKAVLLLFLTAVGQLLTAWLDAENTHVALEWKAVLWSIGVGFVISVAVHFGLWRPTGAADAAQDALVSDKARPQALHR